MAALGDSDGRWLPPCVEAHMGHVAVDWYGDSAQHVTTYVHPIALWEQRAQRA